MLGLYSGARVNEVAQLQVDDIATVDGVPGFYVRVVARGQRIKGKHSRGFVPLAQPVLEAGFLDYVEEAKAAGHVQLFPNLPNSTGLGFGRQLSRQFSTYIKRQGVEEKGQGFHGFRHTLADRLDAAGASRRSARSPAMLRGKRFWRSTTFTAPPCRTAWRRWAGSRLRLCCRAINRGSLTWRCARPSRSCGKLVGVEERKRPPR